MLKMFGKKMKIFPIGNKRAATNAVEELRNKYFTMDAVKCKCVKCGGIGYAINESYLDKDGYLKQMRCACGGRIRRVENKTL